MMTYDFFKDEEKRREWIESQFRDAPLEKRRRWTGILLNVAHSLADENRTFLEGAVLEVAVRNGRWVLTHVPAGPRPAPPPAQHYFPIEE